MNGTPSTTDEYLAFCAWTNSDTLFLGDEFTSDQYQQPSCLPCGYFLNPNIPWSSTSMPMEMKYPYLTESRAQAEAFPEIRASYQPSSSPSLFPTQQEPSIIQKPREKSRRKITDDKKGEICWYHETNRKTTHREIAEAFGCERSAVTKILREKFKYLNPLISEQNSGPAFANQSKNSGGMTRHENAISLLSSEADSPTMVMESPLNLPTKRKRVYRKIIPKSVPKEQHRDRQPKKVELLTALDCIVTFFGSSCDGLSAQDRQSISKLREQIIAS